MNSQSNGTTIFNTSTTSTYKSTYVGFLRVEPPLQYYLNEIIKEVTNGRCGTGYSQWMPLPDPPQEVTDDN